MEKCKRIFGKVFVEGRDYKWMDKESKFYFFKSKAQIYLKHYESESSSINYDGVESNLFYVDEAVQFTLSMIQYLMSRMRNPNCPQVKPHMKMTCNPNADHFLRKWVEPYLHEDGTPDRSKDGLIRYFSFQDGQFVWGDSKEELQEKYGIPPEDSLSFTFISANVFDNKVLQKVNPQYVSWLKGLRGLERKRLLEGNWFVRETGSGIFKRENLGNPIYLHNYEITKWCRAWDIAGSLPSDANPNPDWTVGVLMAKTKCGLYVVVDVVRFRGLYGEVWRKVAETGLSDPEGTSIILPQEPGQAGKAAGGEMIKYLLGYGLPARMRPTNKNKVVRFQPFAAACEGGLVRYVEGEWNDAYFSELEAFVTNKPKQRDDQLDATSDAFITLAQTFHIDSSVINTLKATDLSCSNPLLNI